MKPFLLTIMLTLTLLSEAATTFHEIGHLNSDTIVHVADSIPIERLEVEARASLSGTKGHWGIILGDNEGTHYEIRLQLREDNGGFETGHTAILSVISLTADGEDSALSVNEIKKGIGNHPGEYNSILVETYGDKTLVYAGQRELMFVTEFQSGHILSPGKCGLTVKDGRLTVADFITSTIPDRRHPLKTDMTAIDAEKTALDAMATDSPCGVWSYLDGENDERYGRQGGRYRLAIMPDGNNGFIAVYLSGAEINRDSWEEGMIKARMTPTVFKGHYDVTWFDSEMNPILHDVSATIEQDALLTFSFPVYRTKIRLSRIPRHPAVN